MMWCAKGQAGQLALLRDISHSAAGQCLGSEPWRAARLLGSSLRTGAGHAPRAARGQCAVDYGLGACPSALRQAFAGGNARSTHSTFACSRPYPIGKQFANLNKEYLRDSVFLSACVLLQGKVASLACSLVSFCVICFPKHLNHRSEAFL